MHFCACARFALFIASAISCTPDNIDNAGFTHNGPLIAFALIKENYSNTPQLRRCKNTFRRWKGSLRALGLRRARHSYLSLGFVQVEKGCLFGLLQMRSKFWAFIRLFGCRSYRVKCNSLARCTAPKPRCTASEPGPAVAQCSIGIYAAWHLTFCAHPISNSNRVVPKKKAHLSLWSISSDCSCH